MSGSAAGLLLEACRNANRAAHAIGKRGGEMFEAGEIYVLPNGRELMASGDDLTFYGFADNGYDLLRYEVNEDGRLLCGGRTTAWCQNDLSQLTAELAPRLPVTSEHSECVVK
jgi:hypothetical protein